MVLEQCWMKHGTYDPRRWYSIAHDKKNIESNCSRIQCLILLTNKVEERMHQILTKPHRQKYKLDGQEANEKLNNSTTSKSFLLQQSLPNALNFVLTNAKQWKPP